MAKTIFAALLLAVLILAPTGAAAAPRPELVLQITVDQLRGDMPWRWRERFGPTGFRYLMDNGSSYTAAHFSHAVTMTAAGHATLATGGNVPEHGIAGNHWYDSRSRRAVYAVEDARYPLLGPAEGAAYGRSPAHLTASTFGDELILASGGKSRVFSVSIKDRAAILMGGRLGKAWWYSIMTGQFVSSRYYHDAYPDWARKWNAARPADRYAGQRWELSYPAESYQFGAHDDRAFEKGKGLFSATFPHALDFEQAATLYSALRVTPMGDELTLDFVKALMQAERIGQRGATDLLSISFSVTDYVGHAYGPFSLEAEDNLLRLDRTLAALLEFVDQQVGLEKTLVVLSADHGVSPSPEYMAEQAIDSGRLRPVEFVAALNEALKTRFDTGRDLVLAFQKPAIYLDPVAVDAIGADTAAVERAVAEELLQRRGFGLALTRSDLLRGTIPDTAAARRVQAAFHPQRSGNVIAMPAAFWHMSDDPDADTATHGSLHAYDTHVPLMIAGPGIPHQVVHRPVAPHDVAATLSAYFGITPPSGSVGEPLSEVLPGQLD
jgi:predicted AlkP superfamily pyrophosphatase or phosphodiesterase